MVEPKQPQDRKPKQDVAPPDRKVAVEYGGESYTLDPATFSDVDFMDLLVEMDEKPYYLGRVVRYLLGDEQWQRFRDAHKGETGKTGAVQLGEFFSAASEQLQLGN